MERVRFKTKDNKEIAGLYFAAENRKGCVIYLHMMPSGKESWIKLAEELSDMGYCGVAIDLRGHGDSEGGPDGYKEFSDADHEATINDVGTADEFLKEKRVKTGKRVIIGASIGANLAIQYISSHPEYDTGIFLSPGVNYHGINTIPAAQKMPAGDRLLFVSSEDDIANPGQVANIIHALPTKLQMKSGKIIYKSAGHGTDMFKTGESPNLINSIAEFIEKTD